MNDDALPLQNVADRRRDVLILARHQSRRRLDDRHRAAEAAEHLGEFQTDITAAEHDQMSRQKLNVQDGCVGEIMDRREAGDRRHHGAAADVDEESVGGDPLAADFDFARRDETAMAADHRAVRHVVQPRLDVLHRRDRYRVLARLDLLHIDANAPSMTTP